MTIRLSTGARNGCAGSSGLAGMFNCGYMKVFSGSQPANPDLSETGTNLGIITQASGALTKETRATATLTVTGGSGTLTSVTVGTLEICPDLASAPVVWTTSNEVTALLIAAAINRNGVAEARVATNVITLRLRPGRGVTTLAVAAAGITCTGSSFAGGVLPVNGLILGSPVAGVIAKLPSQVWSFVGINGPVTAGWFRLYGSDDPEGATGAILYPRIDGSIATSGGDLNLSNISIATGSANTIDTFQFTMPAS
ncbi:MAG: hypothetical protein Q8N51_05840 [Gammaproteobacteria bacterium]|nr:hypothetical protein [Gammaproteobacteria bacterium]